MIYKNCPGNGNPLDWKLNCNECGELIYFDNYNNFHNRKSAQKKGNSVRCLECKEKKLKKNQISSNPEDWKIQCCSCPDLIVYTNKNSYGAQLNRIARTGKGLMCKECIKEAYNHRTRKDALYSKDPKDWYVICSENGCDKVIQYKGRKSYCGAMKRIKDGNGPVCRSCASKRADRTSEEYRNKLRCPCTEENREKAKQRFANMSPEEKEELSKRHSEIMYNTWASYTEEEYAKRSALNATTSRMSEEALLIRRIRLSEKARERVKLYGGKPGFQPAYNIESIEYIENVLNIEYKTEFIHAENRNTEFYIFDDEMKKYYYADAYCPRLNLWIEFDEGYKFKRGYLLEDHIQRHNRIKELLKCNIIRFSVKKIKRNNIIEYQEFYNDLVGNTNLKRKIL